MSVFKQVFDLCMNENMLLFSYRGGGGGAIDTNKYE